MTINLTLCVAGQAIPGVIFQEPHVRAAHPDNIECP
ncbi:hypothetical protein SAMN05421869_107277 [Nonomuraea jiangxiensis]|uniref:Uncharacterized protein n=1 Tax=Nonomuraea jiangxiensis TaxID=633440 RepID=A0A1G8NZS1_9ACTN|nr:hypothetical protein SAMN05421869_107277 [Nonomuraea jiangxiensis]